MVFFFTLRSIFSFNRITSYCELTISEHLRKGAFLSSIRHHSKYIGRLSSRLSSWFLIFYGQDWGILPHKIGFLFSELRLLTADNLKLKSIDRSNFESLFHLEILNLKQNLIEQIPSRCFDDLKKVREINMSDNKLTAISADTFIHNSLLGLIDLSSNQIQPTELENLKNSTPSCSIRI